MESTSEVKLKGSLLSQAKKNDAEALKTMFSQFIDPGEKIELTSYLGCKGIFGIGAHSFGCVTSKRAASIQVSSFGELWYQDGTIEDINSNIIYQPSLFWLYILSILLILSTFGIGIILLPFLVRGFYMLKKCGVVFCIKEGVSVYFSCDRKSIPVTCRMLRKVSEIRDQRITSLRAR